MPTSTRGRGSPQPAQKISAPLNINNTIKQAADADLRSLRREARPPQRTGMPEGADPRSLRIKYEVPICEQKYEMCSSRGSTQPAQLKEAPELPESTRGMPKGLKQPPQDSHNKTKTKLKKH